MAAKNWLCAAVLLALPSLTGCGGSSSSGTSAPTPMPLSASATLSDGLTATLTEDRSTVSVGGTVTYTATLTNPTALPITYQPVISGAASFSGPAFGVPATLVVDSPAGQTVYPVGVIANFVGIGPSVTLTPGQSVSGTQAVSTNTDTGLTVSQGYFAAGRYTASAYFSVVSGTSANSQPIAATAGPLTVTAQ